MQTKCSNTAVWPHIDRNILEVDINTVKAMEQNRGVEEYKS